LESAAARAMSACSIEDEEDMEEACMALDDRKAATAAGVGTQAGDHVPRHRERGAHIEPDGKARQGKAQTQMQTQMRSL